TWQCSARARGRAAALNHFGLTQNDFLTKFAVDARPRAWMTRLAKLLDDGRSDIQIAWVRTGASRAAGLEALFELERMLLRNGKASGADMVGKQACGRPKPIDRNPDIVVDFTDAPPDAAAGCRLYLRPLYNGAAGEDAVLAA